MDRKRLHISPFRPTNVSVVLSQELQSVATDITFHEVQAFPEKAYGYVTLPNQQADKLKQKLNGCFLKGEKLRIEEARLHKSMGGEVCQDHVSENQRDRTEKQRKGDKREGKGRALAGIELPASRKVQRGWSGDDDGKKRKIKKDKKAAGKVNKSVSKDEDVHCLFKTNLPPNKKSLESSKLKKRKRGEQDSTIVREFEQTAKHSTFLKESGPKQQAKLVKEFIDGKGWVDEDGIVIEAVKPSIRSTRATRSNGMKSVLPESSIVANAKAKSHNDADHEKAESTDFQDETSSSGSSTSESESSLISSGDSGKGQDYPQGPAKTMPPRSESTSTFHQKASKFIQPEPQVITEGEELSHESSAADIHPLEALFKKPKNATSETRAAKKPNLAVSTSFSFFDQDTGSNDDEHISTKEGLSSSSVSNKGHSRELIPQTPFTEQDIRHRRQRSAAPTPDTAAPGRTFTWRTDDSDLEKSSEEDDEPEGESTATKDDVGPSSLDTKPEENGESEFVKWFWEHRGENNRAWKRKRREAIKAQKLKERKARNE